VKEAFDHLVAAEKNRGRCTDDRPVSVCEKGGEGKRLLLLRRERPSEKEKKKNGKVVEFFRPEGALGERGGERRERLCRSRGKGKQPDPRPGGVGENRGGGESLATADRGY